MTNYFRAIALGYDGTIAFGAPPERAVLEALRDVRGASYRTVLVTGRLLTELAEEFPAMYHYFDAIVAENGAVIWCDGQTRELGARVSEGLERALSEQQIPIRRGRVILATQTNYDHAVLETWARLGRDEQLLRNGEMLMIVPADISKGTGLHQALSALGISHHNAIGIGGAENDYALLEACELGVAPADAVAALKDAADLVLEDAGAKAVARFLEERVSHELRGLWPRRHFIELGSTEDGRKASVPGSAARGIADPSVALLVGFDHLRRHRATSAWASIVVRGGVWFPNQRL